LSSKSSTSVDEVYMIVSIVILFKFRWNELLLFEYLGFKLELTFKLVKVLRLLSVRVGVVVDVHGLCVLIWLRFGFVILIFLV